MAQLQQHRYDNLIRRVGAIIGTGSMVAESISELFPMIDVERVPGELLVLANTRLCFGGSVVGQVAGNVSRLQLFNPPDSGVIMTVSKVLFATSATVQVRFGIRNNLPLITNTNDGVFRETRLGITDRATGEIREQSNNPSTAPSNGITRTIADVVNTLEDENGIAVLSEGFGWEISPASANVALYCTIFWREREVEASEINF